MDTSIVPLKRCTKCGQEYPVTPEYFPRAKNTKTGLRPDCKICHRAASRQYLAEHIDEHRVYNQQYDLDHAKERREYKRQWYEKNIERERAKSNRRAKENPEKARLYKRNRDARKYAAEGTHTAADIEEQHKRQKGRCYYCGCKMTKTPHKPNSATVDHVVPLDRGGRNSPDNLVIACARCNKSKQNKLPHEWVEGGRLL